MEHGLYGVKSFKVLRPYTLEIRFDDGLTRVVDFDGVLEGEIYGPLKNLALFQSVKLDEESGNLVWPNGADFDPEILHDWPERKGAMLAAAVRWKRYSPGWGASGGMLHILWYVIIGLIAGVIAKVILHTHMGFFMTTLLGIVGSIVGGLIARSFSVRSQTVAQHEGVYATCAAILGAVLLTLVLVIFTGGS